ncbi:hypothetical protein [Arcticibacter eurypsychrophilus]|uniref:hypothetical protein n=1 Tax=Arcticibacter eurypsychrophilus TaxID=1434752 RepID=UPI00084DDA37|nr:hypothetical protein [Arcticibacter eurypsychrophilus]
MSTETQVYDYNLLLEVADNLLNTPYIESHEIDWDKLKRCSYDSIVQKLCEIDSEYSRYLFLLHVFERIYDYPNSYLISQIWSILFNLAEKQEKYLAEQLKDEAERKHFDGEEIWEDFLLNEKVRDYVLGCDGVLFFIISELSDVCPRFKLDFNLLISKALIQFSNPDMGRVHYIWTKLDGTTNQDDRSYSPKAELQKYKDMDTNNPSTIATVKPAPKVKEVFKSFADAAISEDRLNEMYKILLDKKIIDNEHTKLGTDTMFYSLIKRFKKDKYFKTITLIELHPLVNKEFNMTGILQALKQADPYAYKLS